MSEQPQYTYDQFEELVPTTGVRDWAYQARTDLSRYIKPLTIKDDVKPYAELVEKQLIVLETAIKVKGTAEGTARAAFIEWLKLNDYEGGFLFYVRKKDAEVRAANEVAAQQAVQKIIQSACTAAVQERKSYAGVGDKIGTVVAGMSELVNGKTYTGNSGGFVRAEQQHPLMNELLSRTPQGENWPVEACAEVDAMNKYLIAAKAKLLSDIPRGKLFFHAETYNWEDGKWQGRKACRNCDQWITRIGAGRV